VPIINFKLPPIVDDRGAADDKVGAAQASQENHMRTPRQHDARKVLLRGEISAQDTDHGDASSGAVDSKLVAQLLRKMVMARIQELERASERARQQQDDLVAALRRVRQRQMELKCDLTMAHTTAHLLCAKSVLLRADEDFNVCAERAVLTLPDTELGVPREDPARWMS
jgi:chromosome condensin MukBEF ATPase and DNA-binding subunit MukB